MNSRIAKYRKVRVRSKPGINRLQREVQKRVRGSKAKDFWLDRSPLFINDAIERYPDITKKISTPRKPKD